MYLRRLGRTLLITIAGLAVTACAVSIVAAQNKDQTGMNPLDELKNAFLNFKESITKDEERISVVSMTAPPVGAVVAYAGPIDEKHGLKGSWMLCDGRPLSRTDYPELFESIGTVYGSGSNAKGEQLPQANFNLPDYEGYFLRGVDALKTIDKGPRTPEGAVGSREDFSTALPKNPFTTEVGGGHQHTMDFEITAGRSNGGTANTVANPRLAGGRQKSTDAAGDHRHTVTTGGDQETRPVNIGVNWIIRVK